MKSKVICAAISFIIVLTMLFSACAEEATPTPTATPPAPTATTPTPTAQANWWDELGEPQYGGEMTYRMGQLGAKFDPYFPDEGGMMQHYVYEKLFMQDWTVDRDEWSFKPFWYPNEYSVGMLVESWESPDPQTIICHIRQGVHYHDKAPANGREFTADDVVYHFHRVFGTGSGFDTPNPVLSAWAAAIDEATATDKYTVVFKFNAPTYYLNFGTIAEISSVAIIECREVVEAGIDDWRNACGTGAYMLTDFAADTSLTLTKNPDYWGYDQRHPENRLPYIDTIKILCIPDLPTAIAALRTGKIDILASIDWQQANSVLQSNPELQHSQTLAAGMVVNMRCDTEPFTDINVRKALQMSIDRETIAESYYGGTVDATPCGLINTMYNGWYTPYSEWPKELQEEYSYNPTRAREMLADAGYPNGFKTNVYTSSGGDLQLLQVVKAYFMEVGVDMEIKTFDPVTHHNLIGEKKHDQMDVAGWVGFPRPPWISAADLLTYARGNSTVHNDTYYDELVDKARAANTADEMKQCINELDMYVIEHHWGVTLMPISASTIWQPYVKGYTGENLGWV